MYKTPAKRLFASHKAVLASESFQIPVTIYSAAKSSEAALDGLHHAFEEIGSFVARQVNETPGIAMLPFGESPSPRMSRIELVVQGKDHQYMLSLPLSCPIPSNLDFWGRVKLVSLVYERLTELGAAFDDKKGITLVLDEARLDQQTRDTEQDVPA